LAFGIILDVATSGAGNPSEAFERHLEFETLLADLSSRFVNLPPADVDREIEGALRRICEPLGIDLAVLWQWSDASSIIVPTHAWCAVESLRPSEPMRQDQYPWAARQMRAGVPVILSSIAELPADAAVDRETCAQLGIKSNVSLPLALGGEAPIGAVGFNTLRAERDWPDALVKRLQLVAQVFANALARRRSELALLESQERLSLAVESAGAGLWELDFATGAFWVTEKARALFGYQPEEVVDLEQLRASVHPDDWALVHGAIERSADGEPVNVEYRITLPEGRLRWISSRGRPHLGPAGRPDRLMGLSVDVTERQRAAEALRVNEARLKAGADLVGLAFYEIDYANAVAYFDDRLMELLGVPPDRMEGLQKVEFFLGRVSPDDLPWFTDVRAKLHGGQIDRFSMEHRYLHPGRGQIWLQHFASVGARDRSGRALSSYGVLRDITERKQSEDATLVSEARLQAAVELVGLGYYEIDYARGSAFFDDRLLAILGVPPDQREGVQGVEFFLAHIHPDDRPWFLDKRVELHTGKVEQASLEYRYVHPARGSTWLHHYAGVGRRDPSGRATMAYGAIRDITARKQREEELKQSYAEIQRLKDKLQAESDYLKAEIDVVLAKGKLTGQSAAIKQVMRLVSQVAPTDSTVLIRGETGTGKELVAEAIHQISGRRQHLIVKVNCAALPSGLVESELFGREKGAFTGALARQVGRFELADGSTIFLDEVGELPPDVQVKLLRVLQEGEFERLGSPRTIKVNVRVIAATNRDLGDEVRKGRFREDLYYRRWRRSSAIPGLATSANCGTSSSTARSFRRATP
jgi:PAS domain S-box-containing protein